MVAVVAPGWLAHGDPLAADPLSAQLGSSAEHWLGTDQLGRDIYSRVVYGARYSLSISVAAIGVATLFGTALGLLAGLARGWLDELITRVLDVVSAFPDLLLALMLISFTGPGAVNRCSRSASRRCRASRASCARRPSSSHPPVTSSTRARSASRRRCWSGATCCRTRSRRCRYSRRSASAPRSSARRGQLSRHGAATACSRMGLMLAEGRNYLYNAWWIAVWPGLAITAAVIAVNALGGYWQVRFERREAA